MVVGRRVLAGVFSAVVLVLSGGVGQPAAGSTGATSVPWPLPLPVPVDVGGQEASARSVSPGRVEVPSAREARVRETGSRTKDCPPSDFADGRLSIGGELRTYAVATPVDPGRERTVFVNLHGTGGSIANQRAKTGLDALGVARGWVVVTPQALGSPARWNWREDPTQAEDNRFIDRLIVRAIRAHCLGRDARVLIAGGSNGAFMAGFTACRNSRIDGVAMVIGTAPATCDADRLFPVLTIRGTADTTVPYSTALPFTQTWIDHAGCSDTPRTATVWPGVTRSRWVGCRDRVTVALDTVQGAVHAWPGAGLRAETNSTAGLTYPASERIVMFLDAYTSAPD